MMMLQIVRIIFIADTTIRIIKITGLFLIMSINDNTKIIVDGHYYENEKYYNNDKY